MRSIGAVVLHYRRWPDVDRCLGALAAQTLAPARVVVVDNASGDGSADELRRHHPDLEVLVAERNLGYGAGMNLGLRALLDGDGDVDAVLVLTHDSVLAPDALEVLAERLAARPGLGVVGPLVIRRSDPDRIYSAGGWIDRRRWRARHVQRPTDPAAWVGAEPRRSTWLDGSALLFRRETLDAVGLFDEDYFMYFEETDHLVGVVEAGWEIECVPAARSWQDPGGKPPYLWTRNRLRFLARRAPRRFLAREVLRLVQGWVRPSRREVRGADRRAEMAALRDAALGRFGPPPPAHRPTGSTRSPALTDGPADDPAAPG